MDVSISCYKLGRAYLIGMRSSDEDDGAFPRNPPCSSRVYFSKEEIDEQRESPNHQIVQPWYQVLVSLFLTLPGRLLSSCIAGHDDSARLCFSEWLAVPHPTYSAKMGV